MIKLFEGDSFKLINDIASNSVKLVMTDVPYPDMTIHDDETDIIDSDKWIEWFAPMAEEIFRVLKNGGSFVTTINCKQNFSFYHKWVSWMVDYGFTYVYNWYWVKQNIIPGRMKRPRDSTDFIAHFYKGSVADSKNVYNMDNVKDWKRYNPHTVIPTNLIYASNLADSHYYKACKQLGIKHNGKYPSLIPELFVKLLTDIGDIILEPFNGSGTTSIEASKASRRCIAFETNSKWLPLAKAQYDDAGLVYKIFYKE